MKYFKWILVASVLSAGFVVACKSAETTAKPTTSNPKTDAGDNDAGDGDGDGDEETLYDRLGGKAGIAKAVDDIVAAELADAEIASYFAVTSNGNPTAVQVKECLVNQLGTAAGGPSTEVSYPTTVSGDYMCRDMAKAHAELGIPADTFDKFVTIAAGVLTDLKVDADDIATIGAVLNGTKSQVVTDTTRDAGSFRLDAGGNNQR